MKKLYIAFFLFLTIQKAVCQPWVPLGSDEQTSSSLGMTAAPTLFTQVSDDGVPYVSYIDDVGNGNNLGDFKAHAKRFINGQWEFAGDAISPQFPGSDYFPVALDGNVPYIAYNESFFPVEIQNKISVKRLNSNTGKWDVVGQQGLSEGVAGGTAIAADNGKIYVAYNDDAVDGKVTVKFFDNANPANGWKAVGVPGISNGFVLGINLVVDNGIPYIAYLDFGDDSVHIKKFNGTLWEDVGTNNPSGGQRVVVRSLKFNSGNTPYIAFADTTGAAVVRNLNTVNAWVTTGNQPVATGSETVISMVIINDIPFVAFGKKENGIIQVNVKRFDAAMNNWPDAGNQPVTASASSVNNVELVTAGNNKLLFVFRELNGGIYAKTFDAGGVLPVSLTAFSVTRQNNRSLLQWATASEQANRLFEIEHGTDAASFKKIGEVTGKGSVNTQQHYSFLHSLPAPGINYYRLKQVDKNGKLTYSKIISITFSQEQQPVITLFPNPVKDVLHVEYLTSGGKEIIIQNAEGKIIKRLKTSAKSLDINTADLSSGAYFISIHEGEIIETRPFIK